MRIVIDMQAVQNNSKDRGIGRYVRSLVDALLQNSKEHEIILVFNGAFVETLETLLSEYAKQLPEHHLIVFDMLDEVDHFNEGHILSRKLSELLKEYAIAKLEPDLFLVGSLFEGGTDSTVVSIKAHYPHIKTGVILYDLIPLLWPEKYLAYPPVRLWYEEKLYFLKQADHLFSISEASKQEAIKYLLLPDASITTISSAADTCLFYPSAPIDHAYLQALNISKPFLMHTSAYEERKNFDRLIEAFSCLPVHLKKEYQLVLVCKLTSFQEEHLKQRMRSCGFENNEVILTGYVSDAQLVSLYRACYLFVFPSLHEGFGLPILEAMSCGAAAIGSQTTSIPEVIGFEEALFDPSSPQTIALKIEEVLTNQMLWKRLKERAWQQAQKFSWKNSAKILLQALNDDTTHLPKEDLFARLKKQFSHIVTEHALSDKMLLHFSQAIANNERKIDKYYLLSSRKPQTYIWRIEGPFDTSYSLALLNRETARALSELSQHVVLYSTEGGGDFKPNPDFLDHNRDIAFLYERSASFDADHVDVLSRNLYPPRVEDMNAKVNMLHHYAWEESAFPQEWAEKFNTHLHGMTCLSSHVEKIMIDAGVRIPLNTSGCGVDHWDRIQTDTLYKLEKKGFAFLHVSSCFPRKGVGALLEAYGKAFRKEDDVTLVIKTFENPHNTVKQQLATLYKKDRFYPHVIVLETDMKDSMLKALYEQCDALVAPSCAEGFGLPLAEAMLSGLPVITTAWGGQMDFCNEENSWLVDYRFEYAKTHFNLFNSVWAKVDVDALTQTMRTVYETPCEQRFFKAQKGRLLLRENFKWKDGARVMIDSIPSFTSKSLRKLKIAWMTSWKTKCGIATYSEHLIRYCQQTEIKIFSPYVQDEIYKDDSIRCWNISKEENDFNTLHQTLQTFQPDIVLIQFNYGFFNFQALCDFIGKQYSLKRKIIMMLHSTNDPFGQTPNWQLCELQEAFIKCHRVLVHSLVDLNRLKDLGLVANVTLFPHGILPYSLPARQTSLKKTPILASYGFCLPHKGLIELVEAVHLLHQKGVHVKLKMINAEYPVAESKMLIEDLKKAISMYGLESWIELNNAFLEDEQSLQELSHADLVLFPYQNTGESASGAVRYGIASGVPVAVTPLAIFDDLGGAVFKLPGISAQEIAFGIHHSLEALSANEPDALNVIHEAKRWRDAHDYRLLSKRLENICMSLHVNQPL